MKNIKFLSKKNASKKGFALTEVLLAIAVIVIIGIAAYPLYRNARVTSEVEATANDLAVLQTNVQTLYSGQAGYNSGTPLTATIIENAGLAPDDLKTATAGTWNNTWGGVVTVVPSAAVGPIAANAGFTIGVTKVPQSACTQLVNRVAPAFQVIGKAVDDGSVKGTSATTPNVVDLAALATACPTAGGDLYFTSN